MAYFLAPAADARPQFFDSQGNVLAGGEMYWYAAGTTTPEDTYTTSAGSVANANPIVLDAAGRPSTGIYLEEGVSYKLVVKDSAGNTIFTQDNIVGITTALSTSEWAASGLTPTYISATQFSVPGDQTADLHKRRRLKLTDAGGTKYATITASAFTTLTTVTVEVDAGGSLQTPVTAVSWSIIRADNPSIDADMVHRKSSDAVASAATCDIWSIQGDYVHITGTTAITSLGTSPYAGAMRTIVFDGSLTLTHNATTLVLPGGQSIQTAANDRAIVRADTTTNMVMVDYIRASGGAPKQFGENLLINGGFSIGQRGVSFTAATTPLNSDDTYLLDRWALLSDGNDTVDVTQEATTIPTGGLFAIALDVETANRKFGVIQFIEQKNCARIIGGTCSLSFKARKGGSNATVGTMRAAVIAWDGTADTLTSDVVSAWNASGTNPTLVANWTYENTPADLTLTTSYQTFRIEGIAIDTASAKNVAVFLYYNNADGTVADFVYITDVQLEPGAVANECEIRSIQEELMLCQRYFAKTYNQGVNPAAVSALGALNTLASSAGYAPVTWGLPVDMRVAPSVTVYNAATGATGTWRDGGAADRATTASAVGTRNISFSSNVVTASSSLQGQATADAEL